MLKVDKEYQEIDAEMERVARLRNAENKLESENRNSAPCSYCGGKELVQKFRNVVGKISGEMHGHFSLFGGSVSGYIDGNTETLPVLSCRNCGNERKVHTWKYTFASDVFWRYMRNFYHFGKDTSSEIDRFFLERPLGTRKYAQKNRNYENRFYNEIVDWSVATWKRAGFKIAPIKEEDETYRILFWQFTIKGKVVEPEYWEDLEKQTIPRMRLNPFRSRS